MKINRETFLESLRLASFAVSTKGLIEQSDCLIFKDGDILTYNGEVLLRVPGIDGTTGSVSPNDLMSLVRKISDTEIEIRQESNGELVIEGKNKKAVIMSEQGTKLDLSDVPTAEKWKVLPDGVVKQLRRAAETCGIDETWGAATCVHVTKSVIEASDNFRLFRWSGKSGFSDELFLPASSVNILSKFTPTEISMNGGWSHFKAGDVVISIRGRQLDKYPDMGKMCDVQGEEVVLPKGLSAAALRAAVTAEGEGHSARVTVDLRSGKGRIKSKSMRGWYRESFALEYSGPDLSFDVHPGILGEIVEFSSKVVVGKDRLLAKVEDASLIIALRARVEDGE